MSLAPHSRRRRVLTWVGVALSLLVVLVIIGVVTDDGDKKPHQTEAASVTHSATGGPTVSGPPVTVPPLANLPSVPAPSTQVPDAPAPSRPAPSLDPAVHADSPCYGQTWPQAVPAIAGKTLTTGVDALLCYHLTSAAAPDGHNVLNDAAGHTSQWTITAVRPGPGTAVMWGTPVTVTVTPAPRPVPPPAAPAVPTPRNTPRGDAGSDTHATNTSPDNSSDSGTNPGTDAGTNPGTNPGSDNHAGATARCNDGTLSYAAHHQGACSHHHGVAQFYR